MMSKFSKQLKTIKWKCYNRRNIIIGIRKSINEITLTLDTIVEKNLENSSEENLQTETQTKEMKKEYKRYIYDKVRKINVGIIGVPEG